ncbi:hypothetical protein ACFQ0Q_40785 [Streptomyces aureus]|uniref:hypothetical protein n=1 Tax=Streptomyces aureus TaxID=193461 RepID=UPI0031D30703
MACDLCDLAVDLIHGIALVADDRNVGEEDPAAPVDDRLHELVGGYVPALAFAGVTGSPADDADASITLRIYTHILPEADGRGRSALDRWFEADSQKDLPRFSPGRWSQQCVYSATGSLEQSQGATLRPTLNSDLRNGPNPQVW